MKTKTELLSPKLLNKKGYIFFKLEQTAEVRKLTQQEQIDYDASLKSYRDTYSVMRTEREEGEKIGIEKGEKKKAIEIAYQMKRDGLPVNYISKYTGLTPEEIELC